MKKIFERLRPVVYKYIDNQHYDKKYIGILAQDIIDGFNDEELDYKDYSIIKNNDNGMFSVDYIQIIPLLIAKIKELEQDIQVLKGKI